MNIAILLDPYGEKSPGGLGRSIFEMARHVIAADAGNTYTVYVKRMPKEPPSFPGNATLRALDVRRVWFSGAKRMRRDHDLYIFFTPIIPLFLRPKRSIVFAQDFAYLDLPARGIRGYVSRAGLYALHLRALARATRIVTISTETARSLARHFPIVPEKITVLPIGFIPVSKTQMPMPVPQRYFLYAGVLKERKNVAAIIRAFAQFAADRSRREDLVIAGSGGGAYGQRLRDLCSELHIASRVHFLGYVKNEELAFLYAHALALVFPSLLEGFGMPVLEAMSVGLPVITSKTGALEETAGDAAMLVNPADTDDIARGMRQMLDEGTRAALREKGYQRAARFSWEMSARRFVELYGTTV